MDPTTLDPNNPLGLSPSTGVPVPQVPQIDPALIASVFAPKTPNAALNEALFQRLQQAPATPVATTGGVNPGQMTGQEVATKLRGGQIRDVGAADLERWMRVGSGQLGQGTRESRERALADTRANVDTATRQQQVQQGPLGPINRLIETAKIQWINNNPGATPKQQTAAFKNLESVGPPPTPGATAPPGATPPTPTAPVTPPPSYDKIEEQLDAARLVEDRDPTGTIRTTIDPATNKPAIAKKNRLPGEFISQLPAGMLEKNLSQIYDYLRDKYGVEFMNQWFQGGVRTQKFHPWEDFTPDQLGKMKLINLLEQKGATHWRTPFERFLGVNK